MTEHYFKQLRVKDDDDDDDGPQQISGEVWTGNLLVTDPVLKLKLVDYSQANLIN